MYRTTFDIFGRVVVNKTPNHNYKENKKWFDQSCYNSKREFKTARNLFNRSRDNESRCNFVRCRTRYNKIKRRAKYNFRVREGKKINDLAKKEPRKFWKKIKKSVKKISPQADTLTTDNLYDHFKTLFGESHLNNNDQPDFSQNILCHDLDKDFSESEIRSAVFSQNNNKTPGIDNLPGEVFKASYEYISPFLLALYNRIYSSGEYPTSWGDGIITPIFKKGDANDASNYRAINLINIVAKIYSQLLLNRITDWSKKYDKLVPNQFGFQKQKSITDCMFILQSVISKTLNAGQKLYTIFIDYEKAFDKIDRSYLMHKLLAENVSCKMVKAIKAMYTVVRSCVRYNFQLSGFFDSNIGLKQGDPSSPLLVMLFVNDVVENINANLEGIFTVNQLKLFILLYADDQAIFATSPETIQSILNNIENYCTTWGLKINTS
jgi:hypothetical protein